MCCCSCWSKFEAGSYPQLRVWNHIVAVFCLNAQQASNIPFWKTCLCVNLNGQTSPQRGLKQSFNMELGEVHA
jgi:hypothetical protein